MNRQNTYRFSPPKPVEDYSRDSIRKMAVLFTDIVGSSKYFKTRGDIAGRKMLKIHQDMASPVITGFGGTVVKMLGDSVLAYFLDPGEAIKSAIKLQQKFDIFNKENHDKDQIHIRICIHYGDGILDEGDIFGDVVNMASKFLPHTNGDEITISRELYSQLKEIPFVNFNEYEYKDSGNLLHGIKLLKVVWDRKVPMNPTLNTLMILKPVWGFGKNDFAAIWNSMLEQREQLFPENMVYKMQIENDKSVDAIVKEAPMAMIIARRIMDYLRLNMGREGIIYIPVQIIIDSGSYLINDKISLGGLRINWRDIEPGDIHISKMTSELLGAAGSIVTEGIINIPGNNQFYKVVETRTQTQKKTNIFKYQGALIQGDHSPCFYCGSRAHFTSDCPSKDITDLTRSIEKLGYMTLSEVNNLFFNYLHETRSGIPEQYGTTHQKGSAQAAHYAFYELKEVFQLRLLRAVWNLQEDNWNRIRDKRDDNEKGGMLWIGFDCIRVSNFDQAESIIQNELAKKDHDYRLLILAALLYIEKNHLQHAHAYLKKALDIAKRTPQKIYILFLLSRIFYLSDNPVKAKEMLRKIIRLSPFCTEAIYQEIVFRMQHGDKSAAIEQLMKLIKNNKDYYVISLIDPELSHCSDKIHSRLESMLSEARERANNMLPQVKEEMASLEKSMGKDSEEISEAKAIVSRIDEFLKTDSYFGYLDIIYYAEYIGKLGQRIIEGRELRLFKKQKEIRQRIQKCRNYLKILPYGFLGASVSNQLTVTEEKLNATSEIIKLEGIGEFDKLLKQLNNISNELDIIEPKIDRVDAVAQFVAFSAKFLKKNALFQSVNLIMSLILLPIMIHYLNFIMPELNLSTAGIWHYQKIMIILGGISGIILATIASQKSTTR